MTDLLAADSWLVDDGRVRAVGRHWARFDATCREHGVEPGGLAELRARVARAVPPRGRWLITAGDGRIWKERPRCALPDGVPRPCSNVPGRVKSPC